ncbi:branched-chain amino acid ABC transporter ATP-binding protein/permease [Alcaligenaceae bacterium]|nr:branched-chain amino acid ABC transporter ATP-binding protein/permease [Alcaligenaceae bacterium]
MPYTIAKSPVAAILVSALLYLLASLLTQNSYFLLVMTLVPLWATVGVSWNIFSGYSGLLSFGHAAFFGLGAYTVALLFTHYGISPMIGIVAAGAVGGLAGLLVGLPTFRLRGVYFSLAMLAYPLALLYVFEWLGHQEVALPMIREGGWRYLQFENPRMHMLIAMALLVLALFVQLRIGRSRFGHILLAIKQNELAAEASGINPFRWKLLALAVSGAIAGIVGGLYAVVLVIVTPHSVFGMLVSAQALIFTMFGGVGWLAGPVIGALVLLPLSEMFTATVGKTLPGIQGVVYGVALIIVITMAPEGLIPWIMRKLRRTTDATPASPPAPAPAATDGTGRFPATHAGPMGDIILRVRGLSKNFGGLQAVQDVAFEVRRNEILGIIGPNGAGKTTMFNLLNGILRPSRGSVMFESRELVGLRPFEVCALGVGRTFQVVRAFSRMSVLDNVKVGALASETDEAKAHQVALEALRLVGMQAHADSVAGALPAVQLRLMEIARALATRPTLLLLDEVLAGLGGSEIDQVVDVVASLRRAGITIVIIEHTMHAMVRLADRLLVLDHGKVLHIGEPQAVTSHPDVIEAYLGKKWANHVANQ